MPKKRAYGDDSESVSQDEEELQRRRRRKARHPDGDNSNEDKNDDDSKDNEEDRRRHKRHRHSKHVKKSSRTHHSKKKKKKSRKHQEEEDVEASNSSSSDSQLSSRRRRKKDKKKKMRKRHRKDDDEDDEKFSGDNSRKSSTVQNATSARQHISAQALCRLFAARPVFAQELPILLIRLAGGSTFDLRQMNDTVAADGLRSVLESLQEFGVMQTTGGEWLFQAPPGKRDERVLLRVIRSLLDEVGVTIRAVAQYETKEATVAKQEVAMSETSTPADVGDDQSPPRDPGLERVKELTSKVVLDYKSKDADLGAQLAKLCQTIAQGESISIDGLPDDALKSALEAIFAACGLEKSEMANDEEESEDHEAGEDAEPLFGYGFPDGGGAGVVEPISLRLAAVMEACRNPKQITTRVLGPMRPTQQETSATYATAHSSSDEDEGPTLPGQAPRRPRGSILPDHVIKAQAERRALELKATAAGIEIPAEGGGREEWMIVPGKHDFLSSIKACQPMTSRGFQNKKTRGGENDKGVDQGPIHPAIQAEMDAIRQAHDNARGMSLIDHHRAKKQEEKNKTAGEEQGWTWSRDNDLDAGRRVDKDALHQVLGGAADNLKTKFHGGFN